MEELSNRRVVEWCGMVELSSRPTGLVVEWLNGGEGEVVESSSRRMMER